MFPLLAITLFFYKKIIASLWSEQQSDLSVLFSPFEHKELCLPTYKLHVFISTQVAEPGLSTSTSYLDLLSSVVAF